MAKAPTRRSTSAFLTSCAALAVLGSALAGCGGGSAVVPATHAAPTAAAPAGAQPQAKRVVLAVDRATAGRIHALVSHERKHLLLAKGRAPATGGRRPAGFGPALVNSGGQTVAAAQSYNIYVNCDNSCWGSQPPSQFLQNFGSSDFIHILDQYTGNSDSNRYTYGNDITVNYDTSGTLGDADFQAIVHAAAAQFGTGYGKIYHVFTQQGVASCANGGSICYGLGGYCAYHTAVDYSDIGHTLYSVEPYQLVQGCGTPNRNLVDGTAKPLSHELAETITDPDGNAWTTSDGVSEIGDLCNQDFADVTLSGQTYQIQTEYSNLAWGCTTTVF